jgi:HSP20 family protein
MNIRDIGRSVGKTVAENVGRAAGRLQEATALSADVLESDDAYLVVFDAPGAAASDIQVRYEDGEVLVRIDRFREFREEFEMRYPGRGLALDGSAQLPEGAVVDPDGADATLRNDGTLAVEIPKRDDPIDDEAERDTGTDDPGADGEPPEEPTGNDVEVTDSDEVTEADGDDESGEAEDTEDE